MSEWGPLLLLFATVPPPGIAGIVCQSILIFDTAEWIQTSKTFSRLIDSMSNSKLPQGSSWEFDIAQSIRYEYSIYYHFICTTSLSYATNIIVTVATGRTDTGVIFIYIRYISACILNSFVLYLLFISFIPRIHAPNEKD